MTNTMNDLLRAAEEAASKNDRYLFIVCLLVLGLFTFLAVRWLANKLERIMVEHRADQQQYATSLLNVCSEVTRTVEHNTSVVAQCKQALEANAVELRRRENRN